MNNTTASCRLSEVRERILPRRHPRMFLSGVHFGFRVFRLDSRLKHAGMTVFEMLDNDSILPF
jgi:hypothetical protein